MYRKALQQQDANVAPGQDLAPSMVASAAEAKETAPRLARRLAEGLCTSASTT